MNSLTELNNFNNTFSLEYTDERNAQVIFDRLAPVNQHVYVTNDGNHQLPLGIDIQDIVQGETLNIRLEIDLTNIPNTDLEWGILPSGITTSQVGRVYTASGITTLAQWEDIKQPIITGSVLNYGDYIYASAIKYQTTGNKAWTITISISSSATLPADYTLYNNPLKIHPIEDELHVNSNIDININNPSKISDNNILLTSGYTLYAAWGVTCYWNSNYSISLSNPLDSYYLLGVVRSNDTYSSSITTTISGGPLIINDYPGNATETVQIVPNNIPAVTSLGLNAIIQQIKLIASDAETGDNFGLSVSISSDGNTLAIGARGDDNSGGTNAGSVYILTRSNGVWTEQAKLLANDAISGIKSLGTKVSISSDGNTVAASASYSGNYIFGSVYIFTRSGTTWTQQQKLSGYTPIPLDSDNFGDSIYISGDGNTLAVSAYDYNVGYGSTNGSVYIFTRSGSTWTQQTRIYGGVGGIGDIHAGDVALSSNGNTLAIGARFDDNSGVTDAGSVYIFTRSGTTWAQQTRLQASDAAVSDSFGKSVSISSDGNTLAVGAHYDDNSGGTDAGSVYIFTRSGTTWTQQTRLQASDAILNDQFGSSISISSDGNTLGVGASLDDNSGGTNAGSVYIFTRSGTTWTQQTRLQASDAVANDLFGRSISISNDRNILAIGASINNNINTGRVFIYGNSPDNVFNATTKTLTLNGNKTDINAAIDNIILTPTNSDSSFQLEYRYINPDNTNQYVYRTQIITHV